MKNYVYAIIILLQISHFSHAQSIVFDFEDWVGGQVLTNQAELQAIGISFPDGLIVADCRSNPICNSGAGGAASGVKGGIGLANGEFAVHPIRMTFAEPQSSVIIKLKPAQFAQMQVSIEGYFNGELVSGGTAVFNVDDDFRSYTLNSVNEVIVRAKSQSSTIDDNWVLIDDIEFEPTEIEPIDTTPPDITFFSPSTGQVFTVNDINVDIFITDDSNLESVDLELLSGTSVISELNFCGRPGVPCPITTPTVYDEEVNISVPGDENGQYEIRITACDISGNCDSRSRVITLDLPPPPPAVRVHNIEVNQVVQNSFMTVDGPGTVKTGSSFVPLLPDKTTLIRYYLKSQEDRARVNYAAQLSLKIWYNDGSVVTRTISPNVNGFSRVDSIFPLPSEGLEMASMLLDMRTKMQRTMNFVIGEEDLEDADQIALTLFEGAFPISGQLQIPLWTPTEMGIDYYRIKSDTPDSTTIKNNIGNYIEATYPISKLHEGPVRDLRISLGFDLIAEIAGYSRASRYRRALSSALFMRWPDLPYSTTNPNWRVILGVMDPGAGGNATRGNANDNWDRLFGIASTSSRGNVGAHEAGHLIGLKHAGRAHGECGGGACETFPFINGTMNGYAGLNSEFGVAMTKVSGSSTDWNVFLIDPCPTSDIESRLSGCPVSNLDSSPAPHMPFDMMSYGEPPAFPGFPLDTRSKQWISSVNYRRIYFAFRDRAHPYARTASTIDLAAADEEPEIYLQIDGVIKDDKAYLHTTLEKSIDPDVLLATGISQNGDYILQLFNTSDDLLFQQNFEPDTIEDITCCALDFRVFVPKLNDLHKIVIKSPTGITLLEKEASKAKPDLKLLTQLDGENFKDGNINLAWEVTDTDADPLVISLEYSPDLGKSWVPVAYLEEPDISNTSIPTDQLAPSKEGVIKLMASDGIHITKVYNGRTFCVKTPGICEAKVVELEDESSVTGTKPVELSLASLVISPNPATNYTTISYQLRTRSDVNIVIYNALSEQVQVLETDKLKAPGQYEIAADLSTMHKGIYFVQLKVGQSVITKKMVKD